MLKIYGVPMSVHTRKVIVAAIAKQLPHEVIPVVPVIPDNPPANWRELSPTGRIPAVADGDFVLSDSAAICAYLERLHPGNPLYPTPARDYARVLSLEQYAGDLFRAVVHPLFHEMFVHPKIRGVPTDQSRIDGVLSGELPEMFGYLDGIAGPDYLAGPSLSVADIAVVSNLVTYQYIGFDLHADRYPRLAAWYGRAVRHPAVKEALRREQPVVDSMGLGRDFLNAVLS